MSNRTLIEINHDYCPRPDQEEEFGRRLANYMRSGDRRELPPGVTFKWMRHHSEPDPMKGRGDPS